MKANILKSQQTRVLMIELRDEDDPNFFHLLECTEKEYDAIKVD
jgi:hypothetical protein